MTLDGRPWTPLQTHVKLTTSEFLPFRGSLVLSIPQAPTTLTFDSGRRCLIPRIARGDNEHALIHSPIELGISVGKCETIG